MIPTPSFNKIFVHLRCFQFIFLQFKSPVILLLCFSSRLTFSLSFKLHFQKLYIAFWFKCPAHLYFKHITLTYTSLSSPFSNSFKLKFFKFHCTFSHALSFFQFICFPLDFDSFNHCFFLFSLVLCIYFLSSFTFPN